MASQVQIVGYHTGGVVGPLTKQKTESRPARAADRQCLSKTSQSGGAATGVTTAPEVIAHGVEFVALPGEAAKVQRAIPEALRSTFGNSESFSGCMVLVSEQEARLVTVITLWTGSDRVDQCAENASQVEKLLDPYVDRYLRTRRLTAFLSTR